MTIIPDAPRDIVATAWTIAAIGATTTLMVEQLQTAGLTLKPAEATAMALGIHVDTGSLTYDHATPRDARALAWLMEQGANLGAIGTYVEPGLSPQLQDLLTQGLAQLQTRVVEGQTLAWVMLKTTGYVPGLSSLASRLVDLTDSDGLLLGNWYQRSERDVLTVIGRSRIPRTDLNQLFAPLGGGGHGKGGSGDGA
ncbi:MAG: hypothetical protein HC805_08570 [Alkalinema sp. RL_2_19]|nr:hypothetical protein [Alkalinema sp. RL_2_19]